MKNKLLPAIVSVSTAVLLCVSLPAHSATTLRMAHFWPAASAVHQQVFVPWAEAIEEQSNGELKVQIFPAGTLAKANSIYDATSKGIADIGITAQGYTAGRFPLTQIVELPGVSQTAIEGACILQELYDEGYLEKEYEDTHPLFMFTTGPGNLHFVDEKVDSPKDLEFLRVSRPTAVVGEMLTQMGASPVGLPAPDIYTSMQRGVLDGVSFTWEAMKVFRLNELATHHVEVPFYSLTFVATMNQRSFDRLTPKLKEVVRDNSGSAWAMQAAKVFHSLDQDSKQDALKAGHTITKVENPLEHPEWKLPLNVGTETYLKSLDDQGIKTAKDVYQAALTLRTSCQDPSDV